MRSTHTYSNLAISPAAYAEIRSKLEAAGYDHVFMKNGDIDMSGIGLSAEETKTPEKEKLWHFHWQNLNEKKDGMTGSGLREGRCWLHFPSKWCDGRTIRLEWNLWSTFCHAGFEVDDDGLTLFCAFPPVALWLNLGMHFWPLTKWPRRPLSETYPDTMVIDERECRVAIHSGCLWINPWSRQMESRSSDPWWIKGLVFGLNPFESRHHRHEVYCGDGKWADFAGCWEPDKAPDGRLVEDLPYRYVLKNGTVQEVTATIHVERWSRRPRCLRWTSLFESQRVSIDVKFSGEVGEQSGSWKGGCIGCSYELLSGETPEQCLRRMERERKF